MVGHLHASIRGRNVILNIFEMWVALAGIISGLVFFISPSSIDKNALAQTIGHEFSAVWNISYFVAGMIIWYGLLRPSPRAEIAGLWLLGGATAINGLAIESIFGLRGVPTAATLLALTVASWLRASFVMRTAIRLIGESDAASG